MKPFFPKPSEIDKKQKPCERKKQTKQKFDKKNAALVLLKLFQFDWFL